MQVNLSTSDRYYPAFTALLYGGMTPADAVASVEGHIRVQD
jgi:hypothetical protein